MSILTLTAGHCCCQITICDFFIITHPMQALWNTALQPPPSQQSSCPPASPHTPHSSSHMVELHSLPLISITSSASSLPPPLPPPPPSLHSWLKNFTAGARPHPLLLQRQTQQQQHHKPVGSYNSCSPFFHQNRRRRREGQGGGGLHWQRVLSSGGAAAYVDLRAFDWRYYCCCYCCWWWWRWWCACCC